MASVSRRKFLALSGTAAALPLVSSACSPRRAVAPMASGSVAAGPVPSGRADAIRTAGCRTVRVDGRYDVWVREVGTGDVPLLSLHGGPGFSHFYLECFEDFLPQAGVRFWYYDQLGCGFSEHPDDASLWTIPRYREEVEQVRAALGLERFVLYGHSWGGMLAIEYALAYPQHLTGLVISNMTAGMPSYVKYIETLRSALPADTRRVMRQYESKGEYEAPEYQKILLEQLYAKHVCRLDPWPEPVTRSLRYLNGQIYNTMQGPSEFTVTGTFRTWDRWSDLHRIAVPTLLLVGRYDTMSVSDIRRMSTLIPRARVVVCENGSHLALYDDQQAYFDALLPFVRDAHRGRA